MCDSFYPANDIDHHIFSPCNFSIYYTKVKLGSPPREYNVQIDTGSDILWVTCSSCNNCPQISGLGVDLIFLYSVVTSHPL